MQRIGVLPGGTGLCCTQGKSQEFQREKKYDLDDVAAAIVQGISCRWNGSLFQPGAWW